MALGTPVIGTVAYSAQNGTTVSPSYPAGIGADDCIALIVGQKPSTANSGTLTTPAGWTLRDSLTAAGGYGTTLGIDTGNTNLYVLTKDTVTGAESGTLALTVGTNNVCWAAIVLVPKGTGTPLYGSADGQRTTTPTSPLSIALTNGTSATNFAAGDVALWAMCVPTDVGGGATFSAHAVTATGATFATAVELSEPNSATGNDIGGVLAYASVSSGSSTTAPTISATLAGTLTNIRGPVVMLRLREGPVISDSVTETGSATDAATEDAVRNVAQTETGAAADASTRVYLPEGLITESGSATQQALGAWTTSDSVIEDHPVNDSVVALSANDNYVFEFDSADDVADAEHVNVVDVNETGAAAEASTPLRITTDSRSEAVSATEAAQAVNSATADRAEAVSAADQVVGQMDSPGDVDEDVVADDGVTEDLVQSAGAVESVTAIDNATAPGADIDTINGAAFNTLEFNGQAVLSAYGVSAAEPATANETSTGGFIATAQTTEAGAAADAVSTIIAFMASSTETGAALDASSRTYTTPGSQTEAAAASDTSINTLDAVVSALEALTAGHTQSTTLTAPVSVTESGMSLDASQTIAQRTAAAVEAGAAQDDITSILQLGGATVETLTATDAQFSIAWFYPTIQELVTAGDSLLVYGIFAANAAEQLLAMDGAVRWGDIPVTPGTSVSLEADVSYQLVVATISANIAKIADLQTGKTVVDDVTVEYPETTTITEISINVADVTARRLYADDVFVGYVTF